jgi:hypothetical protein
MKRTVSGLALQHAVAEWKKRTVSGLALQHAVAEWKRAAEPVAHALLDSQLEIAARALRQCKT